MNANLLTTSPLWTAAGWTMLHLAWAGVLIGVIAALLRGLLQPARPETRYGVALLCLAALSISPLVIFLRVVDSESGRAVTMLHSNDARSASQGTVQGFTHLVTGQAARGAVAPPQPPIAPARWRLDDLVPFLPWLWLCGSTLTQVMLATGLVGVERLRRSSQLVERGDVARCYRALAESLGIARRVGVGVCDRLAVPVLIGIVRPMILLPPERSAAGAPNSSRWSCCTSSRTCGAGTTWSICFSVLWSRCCSFIRWCGGCRAGFDSSGSFVVIVSWSNGSANRSSTRRCWWRWHDRPACAISRRSPWPIAR